MAQLFDNRGQIHRPTQASSLKAPVPPDRAVTLRHELPWPKSIKYRLPPLLQQWDQAFDRWHDTGPVADGLAPHDLPAAAAHGQPRLVVRDARLQLPPELSREIRGWLKRQQLPLRLEQQQHCRATVASICNQHLGCPQPVDVDAPVPTRPRTRSHLGSRLFEVQRQIIDHANQIRNVTIDLKDIDLDRLHTLLMALGQAERMETLVLDAAIAVPDHSSYGCAIHMEWLATLFNKLAWVQSPLQLGLKLSASSWQMRQRFDAGDAAVVDRAGTLQRPDHGSELADGMDKLLRAMRSSRLRFNVLSLQVPMRGSSAPLMNLLEFLNADDSLEALHLDLESSYHRIDNACFLASLGEILKTKQGLKDFSMRCHAMPPASVFACAHHLELHLFRLAVEKIPAGLLGDALSASTTLASLRLVNAALDAEALTDLAAGICATTSLKTLEFIHVTLDPGAWEVLLQAFQRNGSLRTLRFSGTPVPPEMQARLHGPELASRSPVLSICHDVQGRADMSYLIAT